MLKAKGRPWKINSADVRLYYQAMTNVATSHPWPWTTAGKPKLAPLPDRDDELPGPDSLQHFLQTYFSEEALHVIKARVRKLRLRTRNKPVGIDLDSDAWALLARYAEKEGCTLSDAIRRKFAPETNPHGYTSEPAAGINQREGRLEVVDTFDTEHESTVAEPPLRWDVRLTFQYPAWDEHDGLWYPSIEANSKSEANAIARRQADIDGHLCGGKGRVSFKAFAEGTR